MSLAALGELLREERKKRSLSVEDVASHLKMSPRLIRDIEAGNESALPPVYVRGFIKSYAKFLNIDTDSVDEGLAEYSPEEPELIEPESTAPTRPHKSWGIMALVLVCALAFVGYWAYGSFTAPGESTLSSLLGGARNAVQSAMESTGLSRSEAPSVTTAAPPAPSSPPAAPVETPAPGAAVDPAPLEATPPSAPQTQIDEPGASPGLASGGTEAADSGQPVSPPLAAAPEEPQAPAVSEEDALAEEGAPVRAEGFKPPRQELPDTGSGHGPTVNVGIAQQSLRPADINLLVLTGLAECWVHATADETDTRQFSIMPGETFSLSFRKSLVIKLGNAGGVRLTYNGAELPPPGKDGQVLTLTFPPEQS